MQKGAQIETKAAHCVNHHHCKCWQLAQEEEADVGAHLSFVFTHALTHARTRTRTHAKDVYIITKHDISLHVQRPQSKT